MSELIDNSKERKDRLKELILKLHEGASEQDVREELMETLKSIPYGEVVEVEQELISEGLPEEEILRLCDAHSAVLQGNIDLSGSKEIPNGHPIDVFERENDELKKVTARVSAVLDIISKSESLEQPHLLELRGLFNALYDVDKHYQRKEYLLFPFLESKGITGPPKVMWAKQDEIRELIKGGIELLQTPELQRDDLLTAASMILIPAMEGINDMTIKEEQILFPMSHDRLTEAEWYEISQQTPEIGFCLYDPPHSWKPIWAVDQNINEAQKAGGTIQLPTGSFTVEELLAILNTLPIDMTFVDKDDKVKYFSQSADRIFQRNRAILNRDVRHCHPPGSAHIVDKIVDDFRTGKASKAPFWISKGGKFIHIEYFALRNESGEFLGTLEVSHDLTGYRALEGEQRILNYTQ